MKTPFGTIGLVTLATLVAAVVACTNMDWVRRPPPLPSPNMDNLPMPPVSNENIVYRIKETDIARRTLKDPSEDGEKAFKALLNNGHYSASKGNRILFRYKNDKPPSQKHREWMPDQGSAESSAKLEIKTDEVIVSEKAQGLSTENLTPVSTHVTQQIAVSSQLYLDKVLDKLQ
jgi:hypothetical protein